MNNTDHWKQLNDLTINSLGNLCIPVTVCLWLSVKSLKVPSIHSVLCSRVSNWLLKDGAAGPPVLGRWFNLSRYCFHQAMHCGWRSTHIQKLEAAPLLIVSVDCRAPLLRTGVEVKDATEAAGGEGAQLVILLGRRRHRGDDVLDPPWPKNDMTPKLLLHWK